MARKKEWKVKDKKLFLPLLSLGVMILGLGVGLNLVQSGTRFLPWAKGRRLGVTAVPCTFVNEWGGFGDGNGEFNEPYDAVVGPGYGEDKNIYVADRLNHRVQRFDENGNFIIKWGSYGSGDGQFKRPEGIAVDSTNNWIYVVDTGNGRIQKFTLDGSFLLKWGIGAACLNGWFVNPSGAAVDSSGYVYVADTDCNRIQKFTPEGQFVLKWGSLGGEDGQFRDPKDVAVSPAGNIYVVDKDNHRIQKFTPEGEFLGKWGQQGSGLGEFDKPRGITISSNGYTYVADTFNNRIQVSYDGEDPAAWPDDLNRPSGLGARGSGHLYVADTLNHKIKWFLCDQPPPPTPTSTPTLTPTPTPGGPCPYECKELNDCQTEGGQCVGGYRCQIGVNLCCCKPTGPSLE